MVVKDFFYLGLFITMFFQDWWLLADNEVYILLGENMFSFT